MKNRLLQIILAIFVGFSFISCEDTLNTLFSSAPQERTFYAMDATNNSYYLLNADKIGEGNHCIIYLERNAGGNVTASQGQAIVNEYESNIYRKMVDSFGQIEDIDGNGKVIFLLLDIKDGYEYPGGYIGGYFNPTDLFKKTIYPYSNEADMLYIDIYPQELSKDGLYSTMAHELQHLISFSNTFLKNGAQQDLWINEGLSSGAEYIYQGKQLDHRIDYFNNDYGGTIHQGNNFYIWEGSWDDDVLADYATVYLFFQWLRIHATNGTSIYKDIINSGVTDYTAVLNPAKSKINSTLTWESILRNWMLANLMKSPSGLTGYKGLINTTVYGHGEPSGGSFPLYPGEGVFSSLTGNFTPGGASGADIKYAGISSGGSIKTTPPYTGNYLLTYNANTSTAEISQNGEILASYSGSLPVAGNISSAGAGSSRSALPKSYPVGLRISPDGTIANEMDNEGNAGASGKVSGK